MFLNDIIVSCSAKSNMRENDLTSKNDTQELLYDTEYIASSKNQARNVIISKIVSQMSWLRE